MFGGLAWTQSINGWGMAMGHKESNAPQCGLHGYDLGKSPKTDPNSLERHVLRVEFLSCVWFLWNNWLKWRSDLIQNEGCAPFARDSLWSPFYHPQLLPTVMYSFTPLLLFFPPSLTSQFTQRSLFWQFILVSVMKIRIIRIKKGGKMLLFDVIFFRRVVESPLPLHLFSKERRNSDFFWSRLTKPFHVL